MSRLPEAVWSGEIYGIKVHVLDDGRRIIDADDLNRVFDGTETIEDLTGFAKAMRRFMNGEEPNGGDPG